MSYFISVCIPAYKSIDYLKRLLDSISVQNFTGFEVIVSDDSDDDSVKLLLSQYQGKFPLRYFKNDKPLGTPANWNHCISKATGTWIKLIHDDDWLADENSLQHFYNATLQDPGCSFFFSAYNNIYENSGVHEPVHISIIGRILLWLDPLNLFKKNYIGNPSCILIRRDVHLYYDADFKWVVDFEYYIRVLDKLKKYNYLDKALVNVGLHNEQVTAVSFRIPDVEIPENHLLINKMGAQILRNIFVYDYYWRLYRNLNLRSLNDIRKYYYKPISRLLVQMINFQKIFPPKMLKIGVVSKTCMIVSYIISLFYNYKPVL